MVNECYLFGGLLMDYYYNIDKWPEHSQDGFITGEKSAAGGCAVNMAATIANLGGTAHVISGLGNDSTADELFEYMQANGLSVKFLERVPESSGKCLVFLEPDGERTFLTGKGAEEVFTENMYKSICSRIPSVAGVTGYYLLNRNAADIMKCLEYLHEKGTRILFDPSPLVSSIDDSLLKRVIDVSDVMTPNTTELDVIQNFVTAESFCKRGGIMAVKSGSSGGTVYTGRETFEYEATKCRAVDTTGAGDSFSGALLYNMMQSFECNGESGGIFTDVGEAIALASECAGITVQIEGPHGFWNLKEFGLC